MKTIETSRLFEKRTDPKSGVPYYLLTAKAATYQQGFYFINNSMTKDGRYLWFYASFPPVFSSELRQLGVIDFEQDEIYLLNDTLFSGAVHIDADTGTAYFPWENRIFRRAPQKDAKTEEIAAAPTKGYVSHITEHLSMTRDEKEVFLTVREGNKNFYIGTLEFETGKFTKWADTFFNPGHGQFNPADDNLAYVCCNNHFDLETGEKNGVPVLEDGTLGRMWLAKRDGTLTCIHPTLNYATHEWWSADGRHLYYCNPGGIWAYDYKADTHTNIHKCRPWHAFSSRDDSMFVYDEVVFDKFDVWYRGCPAKVKFYNCKTQKMIEIASYLPANGFTPDHPCNYHIDPHPRFTENEKYVVYTTSEMGGADLAMVNVDDLKRMTE